MSEEFLERPAVRPATDAKPAVKDLVNRRLAAEVNWLFEDSQKGLLPENFLRASFSLTIKKL
jgi:hypothetical protein